MMNHSLMSMDASINKLTNISTDDNLKLEREGFIMSNLANAISNMIPITMFNRGKAGQIFEEVKRTGAKIIVKNNEPECVLLSPEEYVKLMDEVEDAKLLLMASERLKKDYKLVSEGEVLKSLDITNDVLESVEDVEIE